MKIAAFRQKQLPIEATGGVVVFMASLQLIVDKELTDEILTEVSFSRDGYIPGSIPGMGRSIKLTDCKSITDDQRDEIKDMCVSWYNNYRGKYLEIDDDRYDIGLMSGETDKVCIGIFGKERQEPEPQVRKKKPVYTKLPLRAGRRGIL